jgi:hypothetical protein
VGGHGERRLRHLDELTTFSAVQAADSLQLAFSPTGNTGEWPVVLGIPADTNAIGYQVYSTCGGPFGADPSVPTEVQLVGCNGMADFIIESLDSESAPQRAVYLASVAIPDPPPPPDTDAMPPVYPPLTLTGTYQPYMTKTFSYSNVPAFVSFLGTYHAFASAHGRVYERTAGASPSGASAATSIAIPSATTGSLVATNLFTTEVGAQTIYEARSSATTAYALDVGASLVPRFASAPVFDITSRTVAWTETSGPLTPDLVRTRVHLYRDDIPSGRAWGWRMIAPRDGTTVTYPTLPVFGFDFNPAAGDIVGVDELTTVDVPGGFAAVRRNGFGDLSNVIVGTTDRMVMQMLNAIEL